MSNLSYAISNFDGSVTIFPPDGMCVLRATPLYAQTSIYSDVPITREERWCFEFISDGRMEKKDE